MATMRIYLTDQHALLRTRIVAFLSRLEVVSEVLAFDHAVALREAMRDREPDLVLLDLNLEGLQGTESIHLMKTAYPGVALIAMLGTQNAFIHQHCLDAGAVGVVVKSEIFKSLGKLVDTVANTQSDQQW